MCSTLNVRFLEFFASCRCIPPCRNNLQEESIFILVNFSLGGTKIMNRVTMAAFVIVMLYWIAGAALADEIHDAVYKGDVARVKALIAKNPSLIGARNELGLTPLHIAAGYGYREIVEVLVSQGAEVNARNKNNITPLHSASAGSSKEIVKMLISKGADVNGLDKDSRTALFWVVEGEIAKILISSGARVNEKDYQGFTPLHLAVSLDRKKVVEVLIENGAEVNVKDNRGRTPMQIANDSKRTEITEILRKAGAKQ
jgi:ankyrin repeat protein